MTQSDQSRMRVIPTGSPEYMQVMIEDAETRYGVKGLRGPENRELYVIDHPSCETNVGVLRDHPGAMWREPRFDHAGREAWVIVLPNGAGAWWTTWATPSGSMWGVEGEPPFLTITPSINAEPQWHGWIKDGVMTP